MTKRVIEASHAIAIGAKWVWGGSRVLTAMTTEVSAMVTVVAGALCFWDQIALLWVDTSALDDVLATLQENMPE